MVQPNGMGPPPPGILLSADFASTSWNVMPAKSGVRTERTRLLSRASPGSVDDASVVSSCPLHLMTSFEHMFECSSSGAQGDLLPAPPRAEPAVVAGDHDRPGIAAERLLQFGGERQR